MKGGHIFVGLGRAVIVGWGGAEGLRLELSSHCSMVVVAETGAVLKGTLQEVAAGHTGGYVVLGIRIRDCHFTPGVGRCHTG